MRPTSATSARLRYRGTWTLQTALQPYHAKATACPTSWIMSTAASRIACSGNASRKELALQADSTGGSVKAPVSGCLAKEPSDAAAAASGSWSLWGVFRPRRTTISGRKLLAAVYKEQGVLQVVLPVHPGVKRGR